MIMQLIAWLDLPRSEREGIEEIEIEIENLIVSLITYGIVQIIVREIVRFSI